MMQGTVVVLKEIPLLYLKDQSTRIQASMTV